ncbi:MAG: T9SS type A sorting domain-containing protein [Prevotella sp.]|nr:T9SS type A sorting domain-containing protein [Prevotella sp.]
MKTMKTIKTLLMAALLAAGTTAMADDYAYLTVNQDSGDASFAVSTISKITFDATNMIVTLSDGTTQELPLAGLSKMFFTSEPTGIDAVSQGQSQIRLADGALHVSAPKGARITLYNMEGKVLRTVTATGDDTQVSVNGLPQGVYIVKVGSQAKKIMNR